MLRSLMTAVTGVRAHQTMLDVTGNNIANANTTGFKKDNTIFQDLMYQNQKLASAPADGRGGINPAQVGLGVSVGAIETIYTQGAANYTGNVSDMMINGNGFFIYDSGTGSQLYSRAGANVRDADNNLVQSGTGYRLQGYRMEKDPINPSEYVRDSIISDINIPLGKKLEPNATTEVKFQCNLDSRSDAYLPYGFADLPYNAHCGWPTNPAGTAVVSLDKKDYHMALQTNFGGATEGVPPDTVKGWSDISYPNPDDPTTADNLNVGQDYLQIKVGLSADDLKSESDTTSTWLRLDMVGVSPSTGKPILSIDTKHAAYDAEHNVIGMATPYKFPGAEKQVITEYDKDTGVFKIRIAEPRKGNYSTLKEDGTWETHTDEEYFVGGETLFEYNVLSNMNYSYTKLTTTKVEDSKLKDMNYSVLMEFDETAVESGSNLGGRKSNLTMWFDSQDDGTKENPDKGVLAKVNATVYFKVDGSFDYVEFDDNAKKALATLNLVPYDNALSETENKKSGANFKVGTGNGGSSLVIQQGVMTLNDASDTKQSFSNWTTATSINQGGYHQTKQTIYDCNGNQYTLEVNFKKVTENRWRWEAFLLDSEGNTVSTSPTCDDGTTSTSTANTTLVPQPSTGEVEFCGCGPICNVINFGDGTTSLDAEITIPFSLLGMPNQTIKLNMGGDGDKLYGVTQYASETTTKAVYQNGYGMGILEDYSIGTDGTITGNYSNGQRIPLYRVALATFANQQGLEKVGESMFRATINSGNANIDPAGLNGKGTILSQNLEMSNVDLTEEFTHLIIAQRGFQANTRVITTSDQILEEVVNLKR